MAAFCLAFIVLVTNTLYALGSGFFLIFSIGLATNVLHCCLMNGLLSISSFGLLFDTLTHCAFSGVSAAGFLLCVEICVILHFGLGCAGGVVLVERGFLCVGWNGAGMPGVCLCVLYDLSMRSLCFVYVFSMVGLWLGYSRAMVGLCFV